MKNILTNTLDWYRKLPEKKRHVEFITAVLSVPVMLTVIIINLNNLSQQKNDASKQKTADTTTPIQVIITGGKDESKTPASGNNTIPTSEPTATKTPSPAACIKEVGPVSIASPRENEVVNKNPLCITIATEANYCPIQWSYRFDNNDWSDYTDKTICYYNLPNGNRTFQIKLKSTVSEDTVTLQRSFVYQGTYVPTPEPTVASSSASL
jgi:hypothetical protein